MKKQFSPSVAEPGVSPNIKLTSATTIKKTIIPLVPLLLLLAVCNRSSNHETVSTDSTASVVSNAVAQPVKQ